MDGRIGLVSAFVLVALGVVHGPVGLRRQHAVQEVLRRDRPAPPELRGDARRVHQVFPLILVEQKRHLSAGFRN